MNSLERNRTLYFSYETGERLPRVAHVGSRVQNRNHRTLVACREKWVSCSAKMRVNTVFYIKITTICPSSKFSIILLTVSTFGNVVLLVLFCLPSHPYLSLGHKNIKSYLTLESSDIASLSWLLYWAYTIFWASKLLGLSASNSAQHKLRKIKIP